VCPRCYRAATII